MKIVAGSLLMLLSLVSQAMDTGGYYKITQLWGWSAVNNGAVVVQLDNVNAACPAGYWFQDSANSGSKNLLALALSAYHAKTPVRIYADENSAWTGTGAKACEIRLIALGVSQ